MIQAKKNINEVERINKLHSYNILDSLPESDYDSITQLASEICDTPISLVSFVDSDRQWFKSRYGLDAIETPREFAFCAHAINTPEQVFIVNDARKDIRFFDNPLVVGDPNVIFYAGIPLTDKDNLPLGTLCVIDHKPKELSDSQINSLLALSNQVMNLLTLRKQNRTLSNTLKQLEEKNKELENFSTIAAHDLKSPLIGITSVAQLLSESYHSKIDSNGQYMLDLLSKSSSKLTLMIDSLLTYSKSNIFNQHQKEEIQLNDLEDEINLFFNCQNNYDLTFSTLDLETIKVNKTVLNQILVNLISNAIKYNDKPKSRIEIGISENKNHYLFYVKDNGPGINKADIDKIFIMFETVNNSDKFGNQGNGIGLAIVKKLVESNEGEISVETTLNEGAQFSFSIKK
jgi:signal transduction histidine kinase